MTNEQLLETFTRDEVKCQLLNLYMYETNAKWTDRLKALQSYKDMLDEDANNPFADNLTLASLNRRSVFTDPNTNCCD